MARNTGSHCGCTAGQGAASGAYLSRVVVTASDEDRPFHGFPAPVTKVPPVKLSGRKIGECEGCSRRTARTNCVGAIPDDRASARTIRADRSEVFVEKYLLKPTALISGGRGSAALRRAARFRPSRIGRRAGTDKWCGIRRAVSGL
jgi:hypothetical protein